MTDEELRNYIDESVADAIRRLADDGLIKKQSDIKYAQVAKRLYEFYQSDALVDDTMFHAINEISDDTYFRIIPLYYEKQMTIENLAVYFGVDISTIVRNKKRLCLRIYDWIFEKESAIVPPTVLEEIKRKTE